MRLHDLRHMHATHLMSKDVNAAVVQRRLGHSHVAVTLGTYTHPTVEDQRAALRRLEPAEAAV